MKGSGLWNQTCELPKASRDMLPTVLTGPVVILKGMGHFCFVSFVYSDSKVGDLNQGRSGQGYTTMKLFLTLTIVYHTAKIIILDS